jgi:hypothetical protein
MRIDTRTKSAMAFMTALVSVGAVGCDGKTTVSSRVSSLAGPPLAGATVMVSNAPQPVGCATDAGSCAVSFLHGGWYNRYELRFSRTGFKGAHARQWTGRRVECTATLAPDTDSRASSVRCK